MGLIAPSITALPQIELINDGSPQNKPKRMIYS